MGIIFEAYVLNKATQITLAIDSAGNNITPAYMDYEIYLRKETYINGPLEILANGQNTLELGNLMTIIQGLP